MSADSEPNAPRVTLGEAPAGVEPPPVLTRNGAVT